MDFTMCPLLRCRRGNCVAVRRWISLFFFFFLLSHSKATAPPFQDSTMMLKPGFTVGGTCNKKARTGGCMLMSCATYCVSDPIRRPCLTLHTCVINIYLKKKKDPRVKQRRIEICTSEPQQGRFKGKPNQRPLTYLALCLVPPAKTDGF